ncbi:MULTISPECIES: hypothetical protein [unclassified Lactobacillus]|nr:MULTISPECIES: hypothetical protein [unclassified Lactobacillus]
MLTENLPMIYLVDQQTMSYNTINNFSDSKQAKVENDLGLMLMTMN